MSFTEKNSLGKIDIFEMFPLAIEIRIVKVTLTIAEN